MSINYKPKSKKNNIVVQNLDTETLVYDLNINKAFCLNETSAMVWQLCDGTKSISEIADLMSKNLKMLVSEDFVWLAISNLQKEKFIEIESNQPFFDGKSRREVIKKIGFASMIALPVVASVIAPSAIDAQSGCRSNGQTCPPASGMQGTCCSGLRCASGTCSPCITSGNSFSPNVPGIGSVVCQDCVFQQGDSNHNRCCNTSAPIVCVYSGGTCRSLCG